MGVNFPHDEPTCCLYTKCSTFIELHRDSEHGLYFVDLIKLMSDYMPTFVATTQHDIELTATNVVLGGCCGQLAKVVHQLAAVEVIDLPHSSRKKDITHDISYRVWRLHKRFNHISLKTLAHMLKEDILGEVDVTYHEIILVDAHQDCYACAVSKWRKLSQTPNSGLRPTLERKELKHGLQGTISYPSPGWVHWQVRLCRTILRVLCGVSYQN